MPQSVVDAIRAGGHDVSVITGVPHYPSGEVQPGYRALNPKNEIIDGIKVFRAPEYPYRGTRALARLAGYASFAMSATFRALSVARKSDAVFVYASPATSALPAMILRVLAGVPFVLQVQDVWPDSVTDSGFVKSSASLRAIRVILNGFVSLSYKLSSKIIVISPSAQGLLLSRGVPSSKLELVYNWIDDPIVLDDDPVQVQEAISLRAQIGADDTTRIFFYAGAMGPAQDLSPLISAFSEAKVSDRARLVLVGSGVASGTLREMSQGADGVHVLSAVPLPTARRWTGESDIGVVSLADTELHKSTFPSKIQFLTGIGVPLLVRAPGDTSALAEQTGSGVGVGSFDTASLAGAFRRMAYMPQEDLDRMGKSARLWYERSFDPKMASVSLNRILSEL